MPSSRAEIISKVWRGNDPFLGFPKNVYQVDIQGWKEAHGYLVESHQSIRPRLIVEIGVWKGASTIAMARRLRDLGIDGVVIAVDTWLGAWDHWLDPNWFDRLGLDHGYPTMHRKFMANVASVGMQDYVVPLPLDSLNAAQILRHAALRPDIIHLDGAHDFESVIADLRVWWPLLRPGGLMIGDDYPDWEGVKKAFDLFFAPLRPAPLEHTFGKCRVFKLPNE